MKYSLRKYFSSKIFNSARDAIKDINRGSKLLVGGFGVCGIPENLINEISLREDIKDLIVVSNNAGITDFGLGILLQKRQVQRMISSYVGENKIFAKQYLSGELELELVPQGTLAEKLRSGGCGIPAFYTPTGSGTLVETGQFPIKFTKDGKPLILSKPKETREFNNKKYVMEESITGDFALIKAWKSDTHGNLVFRKTARNFNVDCAMAAKTTIVEVEEIVKDGDIDPDHVHLPGIFVHRIIKGEKYEKRIESLKLLTKDKIEKKSSDVYK